MCGIAGICGEAASDRVKKMLPLLAHRGPDDQGLWSPHQEIALGHTRLAINDLSVHGHQPMVSDDGKVAITVNGEIYNFPELKQKLIEKGAIFKSHCDSEVVLHAYLHWGSDCFQHFNGMFAIGIFDQSIDTLFLARDRLGIKPVYYIYQNNEFIFASEMKAIFAAMKQNKNIDPVGLKQYLIYQNTFGERTLTKSIQLLQPGHFITCTPGQPLQHTAYWKLAFFVDPALNSFEKCVSTYQQTFDESIQRHLLSDVDVATYLSAGFDSASVTARTAFYKNKPASYTGTFDMGGWYDEGTMAAEIAQQHSSDHIKVTIQPTDLPRVLNQLIYSLDEPKMGMGSFPQYVMAETVAQRHKVILTGHGGDELFSGYPVFKLLTLLNSLKHHPHRMVQLLPWLKKSEIPHLAYFFLSKFKPRYYQHYLPVLNSYSQIQRGLTKQWAEAMKDLHADDEILYSQNTDFDQSQILYCTYLQSYLSGLLVVEDKLSMAHALESRTPFLDNKLIQLSARIPQTIKLHQGELKAIIKAGAKPWLPRNLYQQPKRGFPTPLRFWFRNELREWMIEKITGPESGLRILFNDKWLRTTCHHYLASYKQNIRALDEIQTHKIWQLLSLESWLRNY